MLKWYDRIQIFLYFRGLELNIYEEYDYYLGMTLYLREFFPIIVYFFTFQDYFMESMKENHLNLKKMCK